MPELNWIGKAAVVKHHKDVPFRLLETDAKLSCGDPENGNLIVEGDNLHALKALLPRYAGKVKCIYIDPPYNTGNEGWVYNDNVNAPEILKWLGDTVGKEAEDLTRHDKWLCMMYPRLVLLKQFLAEDGAIFVSLDDNEIGSLRIMMDEIFGQKNFVTSVIWQKVFSPKNSAKYLSEDHDYVVIYAKEKAKWNVNLIQRNEGNDSRYKNPDNDERGPWTSSDLTARNYYSAGSYEITTPTGKVCSPPKGRYWTISKDSFDDLVKNNRVWWGKTGGNMPRRKRFLSEVKDGVVPQTLWFHNEVGNTQEAKKELVELVDFTSSDDVFITPKPTRLIQRILQIASDETSLILDSFAGSGTTAHAVLKQNAADGGDRKFILVEMEPKIAQDITSERVRRVINGYTDSKGNAVEGLGGGFQYCRLSEEPLFDAFGGIRADVTFEQLAEFVWFVETGTGYDSSKPKSPLLGIHEGRAIYLLYNGILKDRKINGGNVLTGPVLSTLPEHDGPKVIYAAANKLGAPRCQREHITFKQTPYALDV